MKDAIDRLLEFLIFAIFITMIYIFISMNISLNRIDREYREDMINQSETNLLFDSNK